MLHDKFGFSHGLCQKEETHDSEFSFLYFSVTSIFEFQEKFQQHPAKIQDMYFVILQTWHATSDVRD